MREESDKNIPKKLLEYIPMVHFLGKALGTNYEVFLYDLTKKGHKIIAIENGFISGRKKGSLMSDVIIKVLQTDKVQKQGEFIQRDAVSKDGRHFKSSSIIIKDDDGTPIGVFCINFNVDSFLCLSDFLKSFNVDFNSIEQIDLSKVMFEGEAFGGEEESDLDTLFKRALMKNNAIDISSAAGRQAAIDMLHKEGIFNIRGSVSYVADKIKMSEPSVYRYLNNSKGKK